MARFHIVSGAGDIPDHINVNHIRPADLEDALRQGFADFWAMPTHLIFLGLIYPILGIVFAGLAFGYNMLPLLFPLMSGFALIGPFAAITLYELSRRREQGMDISWNAVAGILRLPSIGSILGLGLLLLVIFLFWLATAQSLYQSLFGWHAPASLWSFSREILQTHNGRLLMVLGNGIGFIFSLVVFAISAISFPLLLDRDVGAAVAVQTSVKAILANPGTMALWALTIVALLIVGFIPAFIGLAVVLPVLGHATWHLYRKLVEPEFGASY